jgi:hypothetical protein
LKIHNDILSNKIDTDGINPIFKKKYEFFIENQSILNNEDKAIKLYEQIL